MVADSQMITYINSLPAKSLHEPRSKHEVELCVVRTDVIHRKEKPDIRERAQLGSLRGDAPKNVLSYNSVHDAVAPVRIDSRTR